jgi:zinc-finger of transposase IS204/IS1001/IS1096/IS1165
MQWPSYRVYRRVINEKNKTLELWVRRKRGNRKLECSGCGRKFEDAYDANERAVRDLPWSTFTTTVHIEVYRVKCPDCGVKIERVPLLPSKAPFSQRFEDAVGHPTPSCPLSGSAETGLKPPRAGPVALRWAVIPAGRWSPGMCAHSPRNCQNPQAKLLLVNSPATLPRP